MKGSPMADALATAEMSYYLYRMGLTNHEYLVSNLSARNRARELTYRESLAEQLAKGSFGSVEPRSASSGRSQNCCGRGSGTLSAVAS